MAYELQLQETAWVALNLQYQLKDVTHPSKWFSLHKASQTRQLKSKCLHRESTFKEDNINHKGKVMWQSWAWVLAMFCLLSVTACLLCDNLLSNSFVCFCVYMSCSPVKIFIPAKTWREKQANLSHRVQILPCHIRKGQMATITICVKKKNHWWGPFTLLKGLFPGETTNRDTQWAARCHRHQFASIFGYEWGT